MTISLGIIKYPAGPRTVLSDIVETAVSAGNFRALVTAVQAAGLVETVKSPGPFTVFAPTDEAFGKLPPGTVEGLLKDPPKLKAVPNYHVVAQRVMAADALALTKSGEVKVPSVRGSPIRVRSEGLGRKQVMVNDATVVTPDVQASNGVIHVIDRVLLPSGAWPAGMPARVRRTTDLAPWPTLSVTYSGLTSRVFGCSSVTRPVRTCIGVLE